MKTIKKLLEGDPQANSIRRDFHFKTFSIIRKADHTNSEWERSSFNFQALFNNLKNVINTSIYVSNN